jgi:hypothetical protein
MDAADVIRAPNGLNDTWRIRFEYVRWGALYGPKPEKGRIKVQLGTRPLGLNVLALSGLA